MSPPEIRGGFLFLELDQDEVGCAGAVRDVKVEQWTNFLDAVLGGGAVDVGVPVLGSKSVGERAAGAAADLGLAQDLALHTHEGVAVFPVDTHFLRGQVRIGRCDVGERCAPRLWGPQPALQTQD